MILPSCTQKLCLNLQFNLGLIQSGMGGGLNFSAVANYNTSAGIKTNMQRCFASIKFFFFE